MTAFIGKEMSWASELGGKKNLCSGTYSKLHSE